MDQTMPWDIKQARNKTTYHLGRTWLVHNTVTALFATDGLLGADLDLGRAGTADVLRRNLGLLCVGDAARGVTAHV